MPDNPSKAKDIDAAEAENEEGLDEHDYTPSFIKKLFDEPNRLPPEYREEFGCTFDEFEYMHSGRAKTKLEYILVAEATKLTLSIGRYERMKGAILLNQQRPAAENLFRKTHESAAMKNAEVGLRAAAQVSAKKYFSDAAFKANADQTFEAAGYAPDAIEGEAFLRALPSLAVIERQIASAQKRLFAMLKDLEVRYASHHSDKEKIVSKDNARTAMK